MKCTVTCTVGLAVCGPKRLDLNDTTAQMKEYN
jgi:hypothetical protein